MAHYDLGGSPQPVRGRPGLLALRASVSAPGPPDLSSRSATPKNPHVIKSLVYRTIFFTLVVVKCLEKFTESSEFSVTQRGNASPIKED